VLGYINFQNVTVVLFCCYLSFVVHTFYGILNPDLNVERLDPANGRPYQTVGPAWAEGSLFTATVYLSLSPRTGGRDKDLVKLWKVKDVPFSATESREKLINLTESVAPKPFWDALARNKTLYAIFKFTNQQNKQSVWAETSMVKFVQQAPPKRKYYLVKDWPVLGSFVPDEEEEIIHTPASKTLYTVGYWKPIASGRLVADWTSWPLQTTPQTVLHFLRSSGNSRDYLPVAYTSQLGMTKEKLVQVNVTNSQLPLEIQVGPMSLSRWQFYAHMEETLRVQKSFGATEKDIDDLRHMLTETDPILLGVTMIVSLCHILLDVLAFKSDISFWQNTKSTKGLSVKTLSTDLVSQIVIAAYLHEQEASLLVLVPCALGVFVQAWKVQKAYRLGGSKTSAKFDSTATSYMMMILGPMVFAYAVYSLVFEKHSGFYPWLIGSLASSVYAFGFIMMTPQIFINYKLKSVAHLPWRFFIYKALNTFIDDLFAFIIRMPTMHRAACFRDDIVFFIYMYQRWIYPTDHKRKHHEDGEGESSDEEPTPAEAKAQLASKKQQ